MATNYDDLQARLDRAITERRQSCLDTAVEHGHGDCRHLAEDCFTNGLDHYAALVALRARLAEALLHCVMPGSCERMDALDAEAERLLGEDA